jgi:C-terminal processing protease CtpA/Prc
MTEQPRDPAQQEAYEAGIAAATASAQAAASKSAQAASAEGKAFSVLLQSKPLGLLLEENPSGRGVSVSGVINGTSAARRGGIQVGDYVVGLSTKAGVADLTWLGLAEVQQLVGQASLPVTLRLRRGGPEPWTVQRDRQGLSIDDMVQETRREFGTLLDEE